MFGPGVQGYAKLVNGLLRVKLVCFIYSEITGIYSEYEQKTPNYHKLLKQSIQLVKKVTAILFSSVILVILAIIGTPAIYKIIFNERIFIMPFFFPYIDYETDFGYYLTSLFHITCVVFGICGNFVNDSWCFTFAAHIPLIKNILKMKFKEMDEILEEEEKYEDKSKDLKKAKIKLLEIFKWHQKYLIFCYAVQDLFFWVIFIQVVTEFVGIVCTIVCIFLGIWPAVPVYLVYSFLMFYIHCALGNIVELSNEDVTSIVYDCCWYKMTVSQQKMILIMLRESQRAKGMSIGGIAPLSMNTALQMTKTIYTFSVMLRESLKN